MVPAIVTSKPDVIVYDNVAAMVETDSKPAQVAIGSLVKVGDSWRALDVPRSLDDPNATSGDRLVVYTPKFPSREKTFWESRADDMEEAWRSDPKLLE